MTAADDALTAALSRRITDAAGLTPDVYKDKCLRRRIAVRMRACGVHTYTDYLAVLQRVPPECERLRDALTINVTRFYRNRETWDLLRGSIVPELVAAREGRIAAWSAGCASGEEAYTVAMLVAEADRAAGHAERLDRLEIDATDVDRASLERAVSARYRPDAITELPADLAARYLVPETEGYRVVPELIRRVTVSRLDLGADPPLRPAYDLILCRNVVIYFDRPMQERLFLTFASRLSPGGVLVLGKVETLLGPARDRLHLVDARERIYRRAA